MLTLNKNVLVYLTYGYKKEAIKGLMSQKKSF